MDLMQLVYTISFLAVVIAFAYAVYLHFWVKRQPAENQKILEVSGLIHAGANTFMRKEYLILARFAGVAAVLILVFLPAPIWNGNIADNLSMVIAYLAGTVLSAIAGKMGIGLTADLTDFYMDEKGVLHQIRMAYGASLQAEIVTCAGKIQMATIKMEQEKADIVVAGGLGAGKEGFALLARLARMLGGRLGASRAAVDAGLAPFSCQIGQSGNYVNPKIYFAFGISGAVQHLAGMKDSGRIVAVNTDERAPIFNYADDKICHDAADTTRMMLECLENRRKKREAGQKTKEERK